MTAALLTLTLLQAMPATPPSTDVVPDSAVDVVENLNQRIPRGLRFTDSAGKAVTLDRVLRGRPVILAMVYYRCPVLCNLLLTGLAKALGELDWRLGKEYDVVTVSLDPGDTPADSAEKRRGFLQALGQPDSDGWTFLTGKVDDIDTLSEAIGLRYQYVPQQRQFAHAAVLFVLTPDGRLSRYLYGVEFKPKQVKLALFEAAGGKVGTSFERLLLRCYRYDPRSKRYQSFITTYFRAGGSLMIVLVGSLLVVLWRREKGQDRMNELMRRMLFLPEQGTELATQIDYLHYFVIGTTLIASTVLGILAVYFMVHYRRRRANQATPHIEAPGWLEAIIIIGPLSLFLLWFRIGFEQFTKLSEPPPDTMDVYVQAKQWMWKFSYQNGPNGLDLLRVPAGRNVRLLITSRDVIHSFYVPAFRVKRDALPGRYTEVWFNATRPGRYPVFCAEFCGTGHSTMRAEVDVLEGEEFDRWMQLQQRGRVADDDTPPMPATTEELGSDMVREGRRQAVKHGCLKCHTVDGTPHIGPTWLDLYGRKEKLADGKEVLVDDGYMTESMMSPKAKMVAGYPPVMPSFFGKLGGPESAAIVEYIKSLRASVEERLPEGPVYKPEAGAVKAAEETP